MIRSVPLYMDRVASLATEASHELLQGTANKPERALQGQERVDLADATLRRLHSLVEVANFPNELRTMKDIAKEPGEPDDTIFWLSLGANMRLHQMLQWRRLVFNAAIKSATRVKEEGQPWTAHIILQNEHTHTHRERERESWMQTKRRP